MPQMVQSSSRTSSMSSGSRRYRTRASTSQVDETLFGTKQPGFERRGTAKGGGSDSKRTASRSDPVSKMPKADTVRIINKDHVRNIRIPASKDPPELPIILSQAEFQRILAESRVPSKEDKRAALEGRQKAREESKRAADERKVAMQQADVSRKKNQGASDLQLETQERDQKLCVRANVLMMEDEEEIKRLNQIIIGAQCHAVRDTQIEEKRQVQLELQEEEKRLDAMMEVERRQALEAQEEIENRRKEHRIQGRDCILQQIAQRQEERMLEEEVKEQEGQQLLENMERTVIEELEAMEKKKREQKKLHLEIQNINDENLRIKERRKEEQRLADLRDLEYTRRKMEQEAEYEAEQQQKRREKEKELALLRAMQERDRDLKAEEDELRARRNQEAVEREWRRKEKEQARKLQEEREAMKAACLQQVSEREQMMAVEAGRQKAEFQRVLRALEDSVAGAREEEERRRQQGLQHGQSLRQQVRKRETEAIARRRELFQEGEKLKEELGLRQARLNETKERKLMELRSTGLPEIYCSTVERKSKALPSLVR